MSLKKEQVQAVLDRTSQEVAALGQRERRALFIALKEAEAELSDGLREWLKNAPGNESRFTAQQLRNALANVRSALRTIRSMEPFMAGVLEQVKTRAGTAALSHIEEQMMQFGAIFDGTVKPVNIRYAAVVGKADRALINRYPRSAARYAGEMERHIRRQLTLGALNNETFEQTTKRLMRLAPRAIRQGVAPNVGMARGLMQLPYSSASRLIRTEAIHAYNTFHLEGIKDLADEDEEMMKRWDSTLDRRGCLVCRGLDGEIRAPDELFEGASFAPLRERVQHPTAHPNCRCTVVPWHKEWDHPSLLTEDGEPDTRTFFLG